MVGGFAVEKRLVMPHTTANKVAGAAVFFVPFAILLFGITAPTIIACVAATFAAVWEGQFIRMGQVEFSA